MASLLTQQPSDFIVIDGISYIPSSVLLSGIKKISLKDNLLFAVLDTRGESPRVHNTELGFYYNDTRYISNWEMRINKQTLTQLSHEELAHGSSHVFFMTNRDLQAINSGSRIHRNTLLIRRILSLYEDSAFDHIEITNYDTIPHELEVLIIGGSVFDDIFEVRGFRRRARGEVLEPRTLDANQIISLSYQGLDQILRTTYIQLLQKAYSVDYDSTHAYIQYRIRIEPKEKKHIKTILSFNKISCGNFKGEPFSKINPNEHLKILDDITNANFLGNVKIRSDNPIFNQCLDNARTDIEMLTTFEASQGLIYPYAGMPWFSAPFGRDGIITAYQMLPWYPRIALGVLDFVFSTLGSKIDTFTDEEPGKVFHELRRGEMALLKEIPFIPYYGSIDATPLSLILLEEYVSWTHDLENLRRWWPAALKALDWMECFGDNDNDGFLEYIKKSKTGLFNQGWKDSHNSVMHANGDIATPPIRLCEVQAYLYRARESLSHLAILLNEPELSNRLFKANQKLKKNFIHQFWDEHDQFIYLALDSNHKPCKVMSSNQGHCLWGKILDSKYAQQITRHLMSARLFSGYGVRTLAADEYSYSPLSYHNGSIWPHDNSLIAEGFRYYNQLDALQHLSDALFDVVRFNSDYRLPELYCGFRRRGNEPAIPYEVACKPQAWAAGSMFLLLKSLIGMETKTKDHSFIFQNPLLPSAVYSLDIENLNVSGHTLDLSLRRWKNKIHIEVLRKDESSEHPLQIIVMK